MHVPSPIGSAGSAFPTRTFVRAGVLAGAVLLLAAWGTPAWQHAAAARRGAALFDGRTPLAGHLEGHAEALPAHAARCANCHADETATGPAAASPAFGPALGSTMLKQPRERRGGPPSRYDRDTFCRLLRTGIDPAHVMLPRAMPRYEMGDDECNDLWLHLTRA